MRFRPRGACHRQTNRLIDFSYCYKPLRAAPLGAGVAPRATDVLGVTVTAVEEEAPTCGAFFILANRFDPLRS